jgi:hypothetical protein
MPCAGCQRRRAKIRAAYQAVKVGFNTAKMNYQRQTGTLKPPDREHRAPPGLPKHAKVVDIRE